MIAYYARQGLQTREILFNQGRDVCYPLCRHRKKPWPNIRPRTGRKRRGDDEQRSYLAEMLYMTELMVTGGRRKRSALSTSDRAAIQTALIQALEDSARAGQPHARPEDVMRVMRVMAEQETLRKFGCASATWPMP